MPFILHKKNTPITSVSSWFDLAPPNKGAAQWKDGRSAKELAKAFFDEESLVIPQELLDLLSSIPALGAVDLTEGSPEEEIRLDAFKGETRNADLTMMGTSTHGKVAITVEAKADESFDRIISSSLAAVAGNTSSNLPARIDQLAGAVLGKSASEVGDLRYQLLHAVAASLIYAQEQEAAYAIFVVMEFHSVSCSTDKVQQNSNDLDAFVTALGGGTAVSGSLAGPFSVPGGGRVPSHIPLFVGKTCRVV